MPNTSTVVPWNLNMPAGSVQSFTFALTTGAPGGTTPWPITGATWEYVIRTSQTDTGTPSVKLTTTANTQGVLTVTDTTAVSSVALDLYPAATATLTPGTFYHALWMNPSTSTGFCWFTGTVIITGTPQP